MYSSACSVNGYSGTLCQVICTIISLGSLPVSSTLLVSALTHSKTALPSAPTGWGSLSQPCEPFGPSLNSPFKPGGMGLLCPYGNGEFLLTAFMPICLDTSKVTVVPIFWCQPLKGISQCCTCLPGKRSKSYQKKILHEKKRQGGHVPNSNTVDSLR